MTKTGRFWGRAGIVALAALLAGGCSSHDATGPQPAPDRSTPATSTAAQPLGARGVEGSIGDVPWSDAGPGWMLATWNQATAVAPGDVTAEGPPSFHSPETLYLVNPAGGRYAIATFASGPDELGTLADWSGDGGHALFVRGSQGSSSVITDVDLHSGSRTSFTVDYGFPSPRFTRPAGKAVLLTTNNDKKLERFDLSGKLQLTYPTDKLAGDFTGQFLSTPDGTALVMGTDSGLQLMGNDGTPGKALPLAETSGCSPVRWWGDDAKVVLAQCNQPPQLWQIPVDGQAPTALTAPITNPESHDSGDVDAWQLPGGTFVQYLGGCGSIFLGKLNPDGTTSKVSVPNVDLSHSINVIGSHDGNLDLQARVAGCGEGQSLLNYDPVAGTSTVLLGPPLNGGSVGKVLPYAGK